MEFNYILTIWGRLIRNIFRELRTTSPGYDGINAYLIKTVANDIITQLSAILNLLLLRGVFPDGKIIPLYKMVIFF